MKNILLIDNDKVLVDLFNHLNDVSELNIFHCKDLEDASIIYNKHDLDIVIINFILDFGRDILAYIVESNPHQNIITISDAFEFSEPNGCDYCLSNFNKIRLLKPVSIPKLIDVMKNFNNHKCIFANKLDTKESIINIMEEIVPRFHGVVYDKQTKTLNLSEYSNIIDIFQFLNSKDIEFEFQNDTTITIK